MRALSLYGDLRLERREGEEGWANSFSAGTRLKLDRVDRSRLRLEIQRSDRPSVGTLPLAASGTEFWRWKAGLTRAFGRLLEVEATLKQTLRPDSSAVSGFGGEASATLLLGRRFAILGHYALQAAEPRTHVLFTQVSYRI